MLALTIVPTSSKKPKLAFHVGFNPTQSELIMDFLRASQVDHERPTTDRSPPLSPTPLSERSVTAELR
jgi:hypothetical protein